MKLAMKWNCCQLKLKIELLFCFIGTVAVAHKLHRCQNKFVFLATIEHKFILTVSDAEWKMGSRCYSKKEIWMMLIIWETIIGCSWIWNEDWRPGFTQSTS